MAHVIFNRKNISEATWIDIDDINQIHVKNSRFADVYLKNGSIVRITAEQVKPIMERSREENSKDLIVLATKINTYLVRNKTQNSEYDVTPFIDYIFCDCNDWKSQAITFESNEVCCKHVFAVLGYLGFSRLTEYQEYVEEEMIARLEESKKIESEYLELENDHDYID